MKLPSAVWDGKIVAGPNGCCIFTEPLNKGGYGQLKKKYAHRLMYEECWGEIPKGMNVLHKCNVKRCVNPLHLYAGTQKENMLDRTAAGYIPSEQLRAKQRALNLGKKVSEETRVRMRISALNRKVKN